MKKNIAVLVSGGGTNLQALLDAEAAGMLRHGRIALVISNNPNAYALERAKAAGVPGVVITKGIGSRQDFETRLQSVLSEHHIDLIILAGFMSILSQWFTDQWPRRIPTAVRSSPRRPSELKTATLRRSSSGGSWSRRNGSSCLRPPRWSAHLWTIQNKRYSYEYSGCWRRRP